MSTIMSRTLSIHQEHEVLLKLEAAGLDKDLANEIITSRDNDMARNMIEFARNGRQRQIEKSRSCRRRNRNR